MIGWVVARAVIYFRVVRDLRRPLAEQCFGLRYIPAQLASAIEGPFEPLGGAGPA